MVGLSKTFPPHAVVFSEGDAADLAYVVVRGSVEIQLQRGGKTITLDTIGPGECFGEMGPLGSRKRNATARTREVTELIVYGSAELNGALNQADPLARTVVQALVERLYRLDEAAVHGLNPRYNMVALARLLVLVSHLPNAAKKEPPKPVAPSFPRPPTNPGPAVPAAAAATLDMAAVPFERAVEYISDIFATVGFRVKDALQQMEDLNLCVVETGPDGRVIRFRPGEIVDNAARMEKTLGALLDKRMTSEVDLCDIEELARHAGVDADKAFEKVVAGEVPRNLFLFRRQLAMDLLRRRGPEALARKRVKRPEEFERLEDLEFLDEDALRVAFGKFETLDQALLLRGARPDIAGRLSATLSQRIRDIVKKAAASLIVVDEAKLRSLERRLIDQVKADAAAPKAAP